MSLTKDKGPIITNEKQLGELDLDITIALTNVNNSKDKSYLM